LALYEGKEEECEEEEEDVDEGTEQKKMGEMRGKHDQDGN